jgi:hypothetical protein
VLDVKSGSGLKYINPDFISVPQVCESERFFRIMIRIPKQIF